MKENNQNLENTVASLLASTFYNAGYRKGVAVGTSCSIIGMLIGAGLMMLLADKVIDHFDKETEDEK